MTSPGLWLGEEHVCVAFELAAGPGGYKIQWIHCIRNIYS